MSWTISIERDELERVTDFLATCPPVETDSDGVWVRHQNGIRFWECESFPVVWQLRGARTTTDLAPRCIPGRLVWHALELASKSATGTVELSVPGEHFAVAQNDVGSGIVDLPGADRRPDIPRFVTPRATAVVPSGVLRDLVERTRSRPVGVGPDDQGATRLGAADGLLEVFVNWSEAGGLNSTFRVPATVTGDSSCAVSPHALFFLVKYLEADEDVTITWPADVDLPLLIEGHDFRASVRRIRTGSARWRDEVGQMLADACGTSVRAIDDHRFHGTYRELDLGVELCDTPSETIRIYTTLLESVPVTMEVLTQVNAFNRQLIGASAWITDDHRLVAGTDLPCSARDELPGRLAEFHAQVSGYGPCLELLEVAS